MAAAERHVRAGQGDLQVGHGPRVRSDSPLSAEYFAVMVLAFTTVSAVLGASAVRGLASLFFGLAIGLVGLDSSA